MVDDVYKTFETGFTKSLEQDEELKSIWDLRMAKLKMGDTDEFKKFDSVFVNLKSGSDVKCSVSIILW